MSMAQLSIIFNYIYSIYKNGDLPYLELLEGNSDMCFLWFNGSMVPIQIHGNHGIFPPCMAGLLAWCRLWAQRGQSDGWSAVDDALIVVKAGEICCKDSLNHWSNISFCLWTMVKIGEVDILYSSWTSSRGLEPISARCLWSCRIISNFNPSRPKTGQRQRKAPGMTPHVDMIQSVFLHTEFLAMFGVELNTLR